MGYTPYDKVYERFLGKIRDYPILEQLKQGNEEFVNSIMNDYLNSATAHFMYGGSKLKDRDDELGQFNSILSGLEIEILAKFMVTEYLSPIIISTDKIESRLSSKDLREWSPANLIKEVREIRESEYKSAVDLMVVNYYGSDTL